MKKILIKFLIYLIPTAAFALKPAPWVGADFSGKACYGNTQGYGPFDYINQSHKKKIPIVEAYHFTPSVEYHIKGKSGWIVADLDYTLRAIPNHHKALLSVIRFQLKLNNDLLIKQKKLLTPVECYLQRAIKFSPKDAASVSLYAHYLKKLKQYDKSAEMYQKALKISPDNTKIQYAYSLLLIKLKQYDKALEYAHKVYKHNRAPQALKNLLIKLGKWKVIEPN